MAKTADRASEAEREMVGDGGDGRGRLRLAVSIEEAAGAVAVSRDSFERHVIAELRVVRLGRRLLVPVVELERWIERHSADPLIADLATISAGKGRTNGKG